MHLHSREKKASIIKMYTSIR